MEANPPSWDALYACAASQEGLFTTAQAAKAGYSRQLLAKHVGAGRIAHLGRGQYRLVHFPPGDHEDLVAVWLWCQGAGLFSHGTALALHGLSDALPAKTHLTLPAEWRRRRLRFPAGVVPHFTDVPEGEWSWCGPVPVTTPARTVIDCAAASMVPDLVEQALREGLARGLFAIDDVGPAVRYIGAFGKVLG